MSKSTKDSTTIYKVGKLKCKYSIEWVSVSGKWKCICRTFHSLFNSENVNIFLEQSSWLRLPLSYHTMNGHVPATLGEKHCHSGGYRPILQGLLRAVMWMLMRHRQSNEGCWTWIITLNVILQYGNHELDDIFRTTDSLDLFTIPSIVCSIIGKYIKTIIKLE